MDKNTTNISKCGTFVQECSIANNFASNWGYSVNVPKKGYSVNVPKK